MVARVAVVIPVESLTRAAPVAVALRTSMPRRIRPETLVAVIPRRAVAVIQAAEHPDLRRITVAVANTGPRGTAEAAKGDRSRRRPW